MNLKVVASSLGAGPSGALWTFPGILASAFLIAWGAEAAQFLMGQGLALALLAWLQTLPEFGVEGVIAWHAGQDPSQVALAVANLTGAIRLLVGLGWPLVYTVCALASRGPGLARLPVITLAREHAIGLAALLPPLLYFVVILAKASFTVLDGSVLTACYGAYLILAGRTPPEDWSAFAGAPAVSRWALRRGGWPRTVRLGLVWGVGGLLLVLTAHPFVTSMLALAALVGIAPFLVVQWIAPVLTELPELVSTVTWAQRVRSAPTALMNLVSSNVNQWTLLAATLPVVYGWAHWRHFGVWAPFVFDQEQRFELWLALLETAVGLALLATLEFGAGAAAGLLGLWVVQVSLPGSRPAVAVAYGAWLSVLVLGFATGQRPFRLAPAWWETLRAPTKRPGPHGATRPTAEGNEEDY